MSAFSPHEQRAFEEACLAEVRRQITGLLTEVPNERRELREVRLEGAYPKTKIAFRIWDPRAERERTPSYALWENPSLGDIETGVYSRPDHVALLMTTWALGG